MAIQFKMLPIESLKPGIYQPRKHFDEEAIQELASSIRTQGLIEPLIVREIAPSQYEIIAGERRFRAAMIARLSEVPCMIGDYNDAETAAVTLIENIQRQNLNLIEEATGYQRLQTEFHFSQEDIAGMVGKSRSHITNILRLLTLGDFVKSQITSQQLSLGHARSLVGLTISEQTSLARLSHEKGWSVRQLEEAVRKLKTDTTKVPKDLDVQRLENDISDMLGAPVKILSEKENGGWLKIKYFDNDTLLGLLERMGLSYD
jgi:ParB family chromosome partitioning protein